MWYNKKCKGGSLYYNNHGSEIVRDRKGKICIINVKYTKKINKYEEEVFWIFKKIHLILLIN
jgi:hypothetical protein